MYCRQCGAWNEDEETNCTACSAVLIPAGPPSAEKPAETSAAPAAASPAETPAAPAAESPSQAPPEPAPAPPATSFSWNDTISNQPVQPRQNPYPTPPPHVPNYLAEAILVTLFCCWPFGIVSLVYSAIVNARLEIGDIPGAMQASNQARTWYRVSLWVFLGLIAVIFVGAFLMAIAVSETAHSSYR